MGTFKYVDTIRDRDGKLRAYDEHLALARNEEKNDHPYKDIKWTKGEAIKEAEYEKRGPLQVRVQKVRKQADGVLPKPIRTDDSWTPGLVHSDARLLARASGGEVVWTIDDKGDV